MSFTELIANSPTPGQSLPITTLSAAVNTAPAAGTVETWAFNSAPPATLQTSGGQYHFTVDSEICIDQTAAGGTSRTVVRGAEGSTTATHLNGASVYHGVTAGALATYVGNAVAGGQYVGVGSAGPPTSGTYAAGNVWTDQTGIVWLCIAAGLPGTWVPAGSGVELAEAELSSDATCGNSLADVAGLTVSFVAPNRAFTVEAILPNVVAAAAADTTQFFITDSSNVIVASGSAVGGNSSGFDPELNPPLPMKARLPRTGGSAAYPITPGNIYTFKVRAMTGGGTSTITTGVSSQSAPAGTNRPILRAVVC